MEPVKEVKKVLDPNNAMSVHEHHTELVKETLLCEDEVLPGNSPLTTCGHKAMLGQCSNNVEYMLFGCPKACGLCDSTGKLCSDFFAKKCPTYKVEKGCDDLWMQKHCMKTCERCTITPVTPARDASIDPMDIPEPIIDSLSAAGPVIVHGIEVPGKIDPTIAHRLWLDGKLSDPKVSVNHFSLSI